MQQFCSIFSLTNTTKVLDVGGDFFNWSLISINPELTIVNLYPPRNRKNSIAWVIAYRRHLPFREGAFDIAYSNSVIEHLGDFSGQQKFASEIIRVGVSYFVQTPNKWFPVEPHLLTPFIYWLPISLQKHLLRNFMVWGLVTRPKDNKRNRFLQEVLLLDERSLNHLFPDAEILRERFLGFVKSLIGIKI